MCGTILRKPCGQLWRYRYCIRVISHEIKTHRKKNNKLNVKNYYDAVIPCHHIVPLRNFAKYIAIFHLEFDEKNVEVEPKMCPLFAVKYEWKITTFLLKFLKGASWCQGTILRHSNFRYYFRSVIIVRFGQRTLS